MQFRKLLYNSLDERAQAHIDQLRYKLGLLPRVNPQAKARKNNWLPVPYKACLVISADFELAWAWRYMRVPLDEALQKARQTRQNIPALLALFDRYEIPVTWATVGHLFLENCTGENERVHPEMPRPAYFENEFWRFQQGDWYDHDPATSLARSPEWYAPDLIRDILAAKVKHEIACHTFSHIDCSDEHCPPELMDAELAECQRLAQAWGIDLKSFVFPANLGGNYASLKKDGFTNYRFQSRYHLGLPEQDEYGLWRIPGGVQWEKPAGWTAEAWIKAMKRCIDRAIETGTVLQLWFHPSCESVNVQVVFSEILQYLKTRQEQVIVLTLGELVDQLG